MKAKIEREKCIGCGLCASLCPEIFSMGDDDIAQAVDQELLGDVLESAEEAKDSCPVECIIIE
ncbi:MAG: ferredoxin [Peptococcaceae bacterium]|nr:ferredoxin [Peptococcaceae bacterium]